MSIRVDPKAEPTVTRRPPNVPMHWREAVAKQLERDVALGVIEQVPPDTPVTWLHSMVITPKSDGTPRRTVDLQSLNRHCVRETHHTVPPAKQARAVPPRTWKSVMDAWNGYHSVPIRPEDRDKTTFITEQGRFRYCRAPMGYIASQDAYTSRYDAIIVDIPRKSKCVDDTIIWDDDLYSHWMRVHDYLELVGRKGVILNPHKFQFASQTVNFAGFHITAHDVKPLPKYLDAIATFPRPQSLTDVRAWFGLVNQVSHYGRTIDIMAPFKPLLSPKAPFIWTPALEAAFQASKDALIREIQEGVRIFDPQRMTCLSTDWSTTGLGYFLRQKHCQCHASAPGCCPRGWRITLAGSRFLRDAEKRYAPVEGEALAVAWALEDTRFFTLGCDKLMIATDHKPLIRILGDQELNDIKNPRLFRIKQRTLMWRFRITHIPGIATPAADATSRYPSPRSTNLDSLSVIRVPAGDGEQSMESAVIASIQAATNMRTAVTWERVRDGTHKDPTLRDLQNHIIHGFPPSRDGLSECVQPYWQYRDRLTVVDDVVLMDERIVIPHALRAETLKSLHSAHQGTSQMTSRAKSSVFWPGLTADIERTRAACGECWRMSPSQAPLPPAPPCVPVAPFQAIAADFFEHRGMGYLVIVDRFSGWPHIVASLSGAKGFKRALLQYFESFGVAEEISTDGGPEFVAAETQDLLRRWGVRHRLSSAYHPQSNGRAEAAVKSMTRLITANTDAHGGICTEAIAAALLQYRNTPNPDSGLSPSQIVFGRSLRDLLPIQPGTSVFENDAVHPMWRDTWRLHEEALRLRFARQVEALQGHTRRLKPLKLGDRVLMQNQSGHHPKRWDRTGSVTDVLEHDQYLIKIHGSGRVTRRNRRFLRKIEPFTLQHEREPPPPTMSSPLASSPLAATAPHHLPLPSGPNQPSPEPPASDIPPQESFPGARPLPSSVTLQCPAPSPQCSSPLGTGDSPQGQADVVGRVPETVVPPSPSMPRRSSPRSDPPPDTPQPRRSSRTHTAPGWLRDYVCD